MNIVVCIKQVPDIPNIRFDKERMTVLREGVSSIINPVDVIALEAAVGLNAQEEGAITVMTMGPPQSEEALKEALAFGADNAVLLTDPAFAGADTLATSHVLARGIARMKPAPDLVLCGKQTVDSDTGHVGPQIAEELDLPQVCGVREIIREGAALLVRRLQEGQLETYHITLPALLTVEKAFGEAGHTPFGELEQAFSQDTVHRMGLKDLDLTEEEVGLKGSATWVSKLYRPPPRKQGDVMSGQPQVIVDHLIRKLETLGILDEET